MPGKKKKVDPEVLEQQFQQWKQSEEYQQMVKIHDELRKKPKDGRISTTDQYGNDLTGDWQEILDMIYDLFKLMKVKTGKVKNIDQTTVRSILFGKEDKEDQIIKVDGILCGVTKEHADRCDLLRHKLVTEVTERIRLDIQEWTAEEFQQKRKTMIKCMSEFIKFYTQHIKAKSGGHIEIFDMRMAEVLHPLKNLIEINAKYRKFLSDNPNQVEREVRNFKLKAIEEQYVLYFQDILRIIYIYTPEPPYLGYDQNLDCRIRCTPDLNKLFYKINLNGWRDSVCDKWYIEPLYKNFRKFQNTLQVMWFKKINHWKLPLWRNIEMIADIQALINSEIIAERLLGNPLRRDQLNFAYKSVGIIEKADAKIIRDNLLERDSNTIENSIPKLIIYHQIQRMRKWKDKKAEDEEKNRILQETMMELKVMKEEEEAKSPIKQAGLELDPLPAVPQIMLNKVENDDGKSPMKKKKDEVEQEEVELEDPALVQLRKDEEIYGRYFILETLVHPSFLTKFEEACEMLRHINPAVQQDIEDKIIQEGQEPRIKDRKNEKFQKAKNAQSYREQKKIEEHQQTEINIKRPPELWNYPKILEEDHKFRFIAEPNQSYIDRRYEHFDQKLEEIKSHLLQHTPYIWNYMIDRVIDVYAGIYEEDPQDKLPNSEFHIDFPHILKYGPPEQPPEDKNKKNTKKK